MSVARSSPPRSNVGSAEHLHPPNDKIVIADWNFQTRTYGNPIVRGCCSCNAVRRSLLLRIDETVRQGGRSPLAAFTAPPVSRMRPGSVIIIEPSRIIVIERRDARANNKLRAIDPSRATRCNTLGFFLFDGTFNANERRLHIESLIKKQPFYLSKLGFSR